METTRDGVIPYINRLSRPILVSPGLNDAARASGCRTRCGGYPMAGSTPAAAGLTVQRSADALLGPYVGVVSEA